ncbi:unnamed protein product [Aspergillus oryzae var. brunneus]|uniref:Unnamed protein product n=1 Tax=Aspergillus oryzae var. brunneus TaxID=332754 RepID=A0ABQ6LC50_ASPOZ|nr:unnamed protein product [Aspergillus oryzae var. brunneus]
MGLSPSGNHHRRRSSVLTATGGPSQVGPAEQRDDNPRTNADPVNYKREEQKAAEDADVSDLSSIAESSEDDLQDDEETGLTAKQRRQRRRRRKQRRQLDARIAGVKGSQSDVFSVGLADRNVMRRLLVNAGLILMWYFFSLAISIVSTLVSLGHKMIAFKERDTTDHGNVCCKTPSAKLIVIIATMTIGVVMMVAGETAFNVVGFLLVIASAFFSGFRWGLTQILLLRHPATANPFSTLFFLTPVMFISLITIALAVEGPSQIVTGFVALSDVHGGMFATFLLIFPGILAFCMISSEFALLKRSSVVTLSICGIFKEVVTISAAGVVFHDQLTLINIVGLVITISSIGSYNYMKISKMRAEARKGTWEPEPDSDSETEDSDPSRGREGYHRVANPETSMLRASSDTRDGQNVNITPADDSILGRRSFRVRASGASSSTHGLTISTANLSDHDKVYSPRVSAPSPLKSAPPVVVSAESELHRAGRNLGTGSQLQSSPERASSRERR